MKTPQILRSPTNAPQIPRTPTRGSSWIRAVGYDAPTKTLAVETHSGQVYHYEAGPHVHEAYLEASSPGAWFQRYVRGAGLKVKGID